MGCWTSKDSSDGRSREVVGSKENPPPLPAPVSSQADRGSPTVAAATESGSFRHNDSTNSIPSLSSTHSSARWSASRLIPTMKSNKRFENEFSLGDEVGQGSYGCLYPAHEIKTQQNLAIKRIPKGHVDDYVEQECLSLAKCSCIHIIQFQEVFITEANLVMCMEFADAGSLYRLMETRGTLSESDARHFFQELIVALDYCDRSGLANRPLLKNVLLSGPDRNDLQQLTVKLCDFGPLAPLKDKEWYTNNVADYGYDAPEFFCGHTANEESNQKSAIWAASVILFRMVCGVHPFARPDDFKTRSSFNTINSNIVSGAYKIPEGTQISDPLKELFEAMFKTDPNARIGLNGIFLHPWFRVDLKPSAAGREYIIKDGLSSSWQPSKLQTVVRSANPTYRWKSPKL